MVGNRYSIMAYCGDVLGLGHLRRNTAIVSKLVQRFPGSNALLLTSLPTGDFFDLPGGVDIVKLPSLKKDDDGSLVARKLTLGPREFLNLRRGVIESLVRTCRPDLLLVDHLPSGVQGELLPILRALKESDGAPCTVLGLRDIVDDPQVTKRRWQQQGVYRTIKELYDAVLIYGSREVYDTGSHYGLNGELATDVSHCGYVCAESSQGDPPPSRRELGLGQGKLVVITAGGGADGYPMMKLCLEALHQIEGPSTLEVVCITGPFMNRDEINDLRSRSSGLPVRVFWCVDRAPVYFGAADLVVAMAGYNTLMEAIRLKKRTLVLPRVGPSAEQTIRAEIFSDRRLVRGVRGEERTPRALAGLIVEGLGQEPPDAVLPQMDGLPRAVRRLEALLNKRESLQRAVNPASRS